MCVCFVQPVVQPAEKCKRTFTVVLLQSKKLKKQNVGGGTSIAVNSYTAKPTRVSRRLFLGAVLHSVLHKATVSSVVVSGQQETIGLLGPTQYTQANILHSETLSLTTGNHTLYQYSRCWQTSQKINRSRSLRLTRAQTMRIQFRNNSWRLNRTTYQRATVCWVDGLPTQTHNFRRIKNAGRKIEQQKCKLIGRTKWQIGVNVYSRHMNVDATFTLMSECTLTYIKISTHQTGYWNWSSSFAIYARNSVKIHDIVRFFISADIKLFVKAFYEEPRRILNYFTVSSTQQKR